MATTLTVGASSLRPLGDRVLIKIVAQEERTAGGLFLPDTAKEKPQLGEVVAVGPGRKLEKGDRATMEVQVGNRVLYSKYSGTEVKIEGAEYLLVNEKDILAIAE
ncbi:co-chaperone GroES [Candidatus Cyanaurora vandensis]|uniref:co-chaperone GroES n=1 Tax=Candidatus Cyanaurora vandensis TaxID=2714958 RepID=UPI00257CE3CD|nr:co-chaperone GroES [Candidatus Cyanaurora vandensis]